MGPSSTGWCAAGVALAIGAGATHAAFTHFGKSVRVGKTGTSCPGARFSRIQDALDASSAGARIIVCPGVYPEQILVSRAVRLRGMRGAIVRPESMSANSTNPAVSSRFPPMEVIAVVTWYRRRRCASLPAGSERSLHVQRSCHQKLCSTAISTATAVAGTYGQSTAMVRAASVKS